MATKRPLCNYSGAMQELAAGDTIPLASLSDITTRTHSLLASLTADDHTQYPLLAGRVGGQVIVGGTAVTDALKLQGTAGDGTASSPAVQLLTGNNGATVAVTVLNNGKMGVGTTSPGFNLDVYSSDASTSLNVKTALVQGIAALLLQNEAQQWNLRAGSSYFGSNFEIRDGTLGSTKVAVTVSGNVGISTTTPSRILGIDGLVARNIGMERGTVAATAGFALTLNAGGATVGATDKAGGNLILSSGIATGTGTSDILFQTSGGGTSGTADKALATVMMVKGSGYVGIGTTEPVAKVEIAAANVIPATSTFGNLHVGTTNAGTANTGGSLTLGGENGGTGQRVFGSIEGRKSADGLGSTGYLAFSTNNAAVFTEKMRITNTGNVGIGTTSPGAKLDVVGGNIAVSGAYDFRSYGVGLPGGTDTEAIGIDHTGTLGRLFVTKDGAGTYRHFSIMTSDLERVTVLASGNVGIGMTAPGYPLHITKDGINQYSTTVRSIVRITKGDDSKGLTFGYDTAESIGTIGTIGNTAGFGFTTNNGGAISEKVRIQPIGNVGILTTAPTNILSLGGNAVRMFWMERHTTANTEGNSLTIQGGGATVGATDKAGGQLILVPGLATGTGESGVTVQGCLAGSTGTADGTLQDMIKVLGNKLGFFNVTPVVKPTAYTQTYATAAKTVPNATASNPPAGGTGATEGAYDTAAHRDEMITSLTNNIADVLALKQVVNALIDDLQALGIVG